MKTWTRVNFALAVLATGLMMLQFWPVATPSRHSLTELETATVGSIRIERGDRLQLGLERRPEGWRLTHPADAPGRRTRIEQLLAIARAPVLARLATPADPAEFGLDPPQAVLHFDQTRLLFGDRDPTQRNRYVLTGTGLRVIDDFYFNLLTLPASHFRED